MTEGIVWRITVYFPPGPSGLVGVRLLHGSYQLSPATPGQWYWGDGMQYSYEELYLLNEPPWEIAVEAYNEDDTFDHRLLVQVGVDSNEQYMARHLPLMAADAIASALAAVSSQQAASKEEQRQELIALFTGRRP